VDFPRFLLDGCHELFTGRLACNQLDESSDVVLDQTGKRKRSGHRLSDELGLSDSQWIGRAWIDVSVRADNEQAGFAELAGEELQEQKWGLIRSMQVVKNEDERDGLRSVRQEGGHSLEEAEASAFWLERQRLGQLGEKVTELGKELGEIRSARTQLLPERLGFRLADERAQGLHPRPVRGSATRLPTASNEHSPSAGAGLTDQLFREPALADPRLTDEQEETASARDGILETRQQLLELCFATDERTSRCLRLRGLLRWRDEVEWGILLEDRLL
jgi:hypothetical protein